MQKKLKTFIKIQDSIILVIIAYLLVVSEAYSANGVMPIDNTEIKFSDGRTLIAQRHSSQSHWIILKKENKVLWKKLYELEYDRVWSYAFFIPVKKHKYVYDINQDGSDEIAVATWDGGNNIANRYAIVFSVKNNKLVYYDRQKFNLEYGKNVYP